MDVRQLSVDDVLDCTIKIYRVKLSTRNSARCGSLVVET